MMRAASVGAGAPVRSIAQTASRPAAANIRAVINAVLSETKAIAATAATALTSATSPTLGGVAASKAATVARIRKIALAAIAELGGRTPRIILRNGRNIARRRFSATAVFSLSAFIDNAAGR